MVGVNCPEATSSVAQAPPRHAEILSCFLKVPTSVRHPAEWKASLRRQPASSAMPYGQASALKATRSSWPEAAQGSARQRKAARGSARQREAAQGSAKAAQAAQAARGSARQRKAAQGSAKQRKAAQGSARQGSAKIHRVHWIHGTRWIHWAHRMQGK